MSIPSDSSHTRGHTRRSYSPENKIALIMQGFRPNGQGLLICKKHGIPRGTYYDWRKKFIEAGTERLRFNLFPEKIKRELLEKRNENRKLKEQVAALIARNTILQILLSSGITIKRYKHYTASEKWQILKAFQDAQIPHVQLLSEIGLPKGTYYRWVRHYRRYGYEGLNNKTPNIKKYWNEVPSNIKAIIKMLAIERPYMGFKQIQWYLVDNYNYYVAWSTIYSYLKRENLIRSRVRKPRPNVKAHFRKAKRINEIWLTDFTYFKKIEHKWYFLSVVLDDYSRYIVSWRFSKTMKAEDAMATLEQAIEHSSLKVKNDGDMPMLLTDRGACFRSKKFQFYLREQGFTHELGPPRNPMKRVRIERLFRTIKQAMRLYDYTSETELRQFTDEFITYYNSDRCHQSLDNLRPIDVYFGTEEETMKRREIVKEHTLKKRGYR